MFLSIQSAKKNCACKEQLVQNGEEREQSTSLRELQRDRGGTKSGGGKRDGAERPAKRRRSDRENHGGDSVTVDVAGEVEAPSRNQTSGLSSRQPNRHWRHSETERRQRRSFYEQLRREREFDAEEAEREKWSELAETCAREIDELSVRSGLSQTVLLRASNQLHNLSFFFFS